MAHDSNLETKVGIGLLLAIGLVCTLILFLTETPVLFNSTYVLTIEFPDATGLIKGADVDLSGALIGKVASNPWVVPDTERVAVDVELNKNVAIRKGADFTIGTAGIFGGKFVEVSPRHDESGGEESDLLKDGDVVKGSPSVDLTGLIKAALPLVHRADHAAGQLDEIVTRLNTDVFTEDACRDLSATVHQVPDLLDNGKTVFANANSLIARVKSGQGVLGEVLYNEQVKANVAQFMANLKEHGLVFYQDDSAPSTMGQKQPWRARP